MKHKLILILMLISFSASAQNGFPIKVQTSDRTEEWALQNESDPIARRLRSTPTGNTIAVGATIYNPQVSVTSGLTAKVNITITASGPCTFFVQGGETASTFALDRSTNANGSYEMQRGVPIELTNIKMYESSSIAFVFQSTGTRDTVAISIAVNGYQIFSGSNYKAATSYAMFSDSQGFSALGLVGGTGLVGNIGATAYPVRLVDSLNKLGKDIRLVQKGVSGITTTGMMQRIMSRHFDQIIREASFIEIALGTNDASAGTAASQNYAVNMRTIINYIISINKKAAIIITAPPGTSVVAIGNNIAGYRTAANDLVTQYQALYPTREFRFFNRFLFVPNPTSATDPNYTETGTGNQLHQRGDTGHLAEFLGLLPIVQSTNVYNNLPTIP